MFLRTASALALATPALLASACHAPEVRLDRMHGARSSAAAARPVRPTQVAETKPAPEIQRPPPEVQRAPPDVERAPRGVERAQPEPPRVAAVQPRTISEPRKPPQDERVVAIRAALDAGDWVRARDTLEELLTAPQLAQARAQLEADRPEEALATAESALELAPGNPEVRLLCGEASLKVGERHDDPSMRESALRDFLLAGRSARAWLGASRAARALGRTREALRYARAGMAALARGNGAGAASSANWVEAPEHTLAQAAFDAYLEEKRAGASDASALFAESEDALSRLMARDADDPWVWARLATLYLEEGRNQDAQQALERGLDRSPQDAPLCDLLARAARLAGGSPAVIAAFERLGAKHPESALARWYPALERFDVATSKLATSDAAEFRAIEAEFRACRELDPELAERCSGFEALCRDAVGWRALEHGDLAAARAAFASTEEVVPGGMRRELDGRMGSGVRGLAAIADALTKKDDAAGAAEVFLALHRYEPGEPSWAAKAGLFHRDAGERTQYFGEDFLRAAKGELKDPARLAALRDEAGIDATTAGSAQERAAFQRAGEEHVAHARQMFETSYAAYLDAARLAPDDVRIAGDAARIALEHLGRDFDRAEELLQRCVRLGAQQLANPALDDATRLALTEAWGDAHESLGVLYLEHRQDPVAARAWFERSLEIGPSPRPIVADTYLPRCQPPRASAKNP